MTAHVSHIVDRVTLTAGAAALLAALPVAGVVALLQSIA